MQGNNKLSEYAKTQPYAAYSAFCHGEVHKFTYFRRIIPGMQEHIKPLDDLITNEFNHRSRQRDLGIKHGGLGIAILSEISKIHYEHSKSI